MTETRFLQFFKMGHGGGAHGGTMETLSTRADASGFREVIMSRSHGAPREGSPEDEDAELGSE